jgi:hypothetical protein
MTRRSLAAAVCLVLVAAGCGDDTTVEEADGSPPTTTEPPPLVDPSPSSEVVFGPEINRGAPRVVSTAVPDGRLQPVVVDGEPALFGPGGAVVVVNGDDAELLPTEGLDVTRDDSLRLSRVRWLEGMTATTDGLVAFGVSADSTEPARPLLWRSEDGRSWDSLPVTGIPSGSDGTFLNALAQLPDGSLLVGGARYDGDEYFQTLWHAADEDGPWERIDGAGIDLPDDPEGTDRVLDIAAVGDTILVTEYVVGFAGYRDVVVFRGTVDDGFEPLDTTGLDELDLVGADGIVPQLVAVDDTFALYGSIPRADDMATGTRQLAFFISSDGEDWEAQPLADTIALARLPLGAAVDEDEIITATGGERSVAIRRYSRG